MSAHDPKRKQVGSIPHLTFLTGGGGEADSGPASSPRDARSICVAERRLGGQFEDQVDRRLRGAPQVGKPGFPRHLA
jgi:hypothetical protein